MILKLLLLSQIYYNCNAHNDNCGLRSLRTKVSPRVVSGEDASPNEFPWHVSLQLIAPELNMTKWKHFCGGSIINDRHILTAAHCAILIPKAKERNVSLKLRIITGVVRLSDPNPIIINPQMSGDYPNVIIHESYDEEKSMVNDIAIIRTEEPIDINTNDRDFRVNTICLPETDFEPIGDSTISGWGSISPDTIIDTDILQKADISVVTRQNCNKKWRKYMRMNGLPMGAFMSRIINNYPVTKTQICAIGEKQKGAAQGDSGGPLMQSLDDRIYLIGIVSFGSIPSAAAKEINVPVVYTRVSRFMYWIAKHSSLPSTHGHDDSGHDGSHDGSHTHSYRKSSSVFNHFQKYDDIEDDNQRRYQSSLSKAKNRKYQRNYEKYDMYSNDDDDHCLRSDASKYGNDSDEQKRTKERRRQKHKDMHYDSEQREESHVRKKHEKREDRKRLKVIEERQKRDTSKSKGFKGSKGPKQSKANPIEEWQNAETDFD